MNLESCRLCGKDSGLSDVFDENDLWLKIFVCFSVKIQKNDNITQRICKSCYFFTNSVYEFRLSSISHDNKLKQQYLDTLPKVDPTPARTLYPSEISQDAFMNSLDLANKSEKSIQNILDHPSLFKLKRKYPNLSFPKECLQVNLDPLVVLEVPPKTLRLGETNLGLWSVKNIPCNGKQPDLVLTRVRNSPLMFENNEKECIEDSDNSDKYKVTVGTKLRERKSVVQESVPVPKKRKRPWKVGMKHRSSKKKSSSEKPKNVPKVPLVLPTFNSGPPSTGNMTIVENDSVVLSGNENIEDKKLTLECLLDSSSVQTELPQFNFSSISEPSVSKGEEYGNLLVTAGEEVQTFICQTCNKIFDTLALLNSHKKYSHKSSLRCNKCSKRFAIVESLLKHTVTFHPETNIEEEDTKVNQTNAVQNSVARKKTGGTIEVSSAAVSPPRPEINEYVISSDDDVEITGIIEKNFADTKDMNTPSPLIENLINAALEPQKSSTITQPQISVTKTQNCATLGQVLDSEIVLNVDTSIVILETEQEEEKNRTINEAIFLIDDSDEENGIQKSKVSNEPKNTKETPTITDKGEDNNFLVVDNSNSNSSSDNPKPEPVNVLLPIIDRTLKQRKQSADISSNAESTSTEGDSNKSEGSVSQKIVVVPSAEDKAHMDLSSSVKAKITNEISYVNYIFNKCSYVDKPKTDKRWLLKDIHKFTEKTYLPIEVIITPEKEVSVDYVPVTVEKPGEQFSWAKHDVIDISKRNSAKESFRKGTSNDIPKEKVEQSKEKLAQSEAEKGKSAKKTKESEEKTLQSDPKPVLKVILASKANPVQSESKTNSGEFVDNMGSNKIIMGTAENTSAALTSVVGNQLISTMNETIVTNPSVTFTSSQIPKTSNLPHPPVGVSTPMIQKSPLDFCPRVTQKFLNFALSDAASNYDQQKAKTYSTIRKPVLSVSPNSSKDPDDLVVEKPLVPNGYIIMGVSGTQAEMFQPSPDGKSLVVNDVVGPNNIQRQPLILNGMSYPSFAKICSTGPPTYVVQQVEQQTNINIQSCINICQQEIVTTSTVTERSAVPLANSEQYKNVIPTQIVTSVIPSLPASVSESTSVPESNTTDFGTTSDSTVSTTRPMIRIKTLSELRGGNNMDMNQRNELHNIYSNALSNYVQNHSTTLTSRSNNDEYLQIS